MNQSYKIAASPPFRHQGRARKDRKNPSIPGPRSKTSLVLWDCPGFLAALNRPFWPKPRKPDIVHHENNRCIVSFPLSFSGYQHRLFCTIRFLDFLSFCFFSSDCVNYPKFFGFNYFNIFKNQNVLPFLKTCFVFLHKFSFPALLKCIIKFRNPFSFMRYSSISKDDISLFPRKNSGAGAQKGARPRCSFRSPSPSLRGR